MTPIYFAQFYNAPGQEACGSNSILPLDGRLALASMVHKAIAHATKHQQWKRYAGFEIRFGTFQHSQVRTGYQSLEETNTNALATATA